MYQRLLLQLSSSWFRLATSAMVNGRWGNPVTGVRSTLYGEGEKQSNRQPATHTTGAAITQASLRSQSFMLVILP